MNRESPIDSRATGSGLRAAAAAQALPCTLHCALYRFEFATRAGRPGGPGELFAAGDPVPVATAGNGSALPPLVPGERPSAIDHPDAVHRAGRQAQAAADALCGNHGVHELRGADDGVDRAGFEAKRAADAGVFVYHCRLGMAMHGPILKERRGPQAANGPRRDCRA